MAIETRLIGLLGGMSWESSALYYRLLNASTHRRLGGHHNARSLLFTLDFDALNGAAAAGRWDVVGALLADAARRIEGAGAEFAMITSVTGHAVFDQVEAAVAIPVLHIADPTAETISLAGIRTVGLLATRYTMEMGFFADRLRKRWGIETLLPAPADRNELHRIIIDELTMGNVVDASRVRYLGMVDDLHQRGAGAIILGCTELPLLVAAEEHPLPAFDVVQHHVEAAIERALPAAVAPITAS